MKEREIDLQSQVAKAILENAKIGQAVIEVENQEGSIILRGNAATEQDKKLVEDTANRLDGVVNVINELTCD